MILLQNVYRGIVHTVKLKNLNILHKCAIATVQKYITIRVFYQLHFRCLLGKFGGFHVGTSCLTSAEPPRWRKWKCVTIKCSS